MERLQSIVGHEHFDKVVSTFSEEKATVFRVNTIRTQTASVVSQLVDLEIQPQSVPWCDHALLVGPKQRAALTHSTLAVNGDIYVQGLSSILASLLLDPQPGEWNLDLAAAPGGKASHLAALMNNEGKLSVVEPIRKRMYRLADNLKRLGVTNARTYLHDGRSVGQKVPNRFDRVLLDAPCSSESRFRADDPETWRYWSERKITEQARKQKGLIQSAFASLKPGGTMLYCTCSFAPEENEAVVDHLISHVSDRAELLSFDLPINNFQVGLVSYEGTEFDAQLARTRRILPDQHFDGFYLAKIRKRSEE